MEEELNGGNKSWRELGVEWCREQREILQRDLAMLASGEMRVRKNHLDVTDIWIEETQARLGNMNRVIAAYERDVQIGDA